MVYNNVFWCISIMITIPLCILLQGMEYVAVATVNAGMDGMEMHVKSGLAQNIPNNYMGKDWILIFPMPLEYTNARKTIYNHHEDRSNRLLYVFLFLNA